MTVIFESSNLRVREISPFRSPIVAVTFSERADAQQQLDRPGFGQDFLRKAEIDGIFVTCRGNDWYQYPETPKALAVIAERAKRYPEVVTYGSSMGAYAAIRFASTIGANRVVAISPQYSIDPACAPFEKRWRRDAERIPFIGDDMAAFAPKSALVYILVDPLHPDFAHARLLSEALPKAVILRAPFAKHPVGHFLRESGIINIVISGLVLGKLSVAEWCNLRRSRRMLSPIYKSTLEERLSLRRQTLIGASR